MSISLVLLGAGNSTRFNAGVKKQWLRVKDKPLWLYVAKKFKKLHKFDKIIIVASKDEINYMEKFGDFSFCIGGKTRQESLKNALLHVKSEHVLVSDIARVCVRKKLFKRLLRAKDKAACIIPVLDMVDTIYLDKRPANRSLIKAVQTPQLSNTKALKEALENDKEFTDDSSAIFANGGKVYFVKGDEKIHKLTSKKDLKKLPCLKKPSSGFLCGNGFDVHAFGEKRALILGGIKVHKSMGLKAHSDGDVLIHALIDAILGAMGAGDIGELFPDTDNKYKNISSIKLLKKVCRFAQSVGFEMVNCDITIMAEKPKISPFKRDIAKNIAKHLQIAPNFVNTKATTTEKLGFVGRSEGMVVSATATLKYYDWTQQ